MKATVLKIKRTPDGIVFNIVAYGLLFIFGMMCLIPFYLIFISSFASDSSLLQYGYRLIPKQFSLSSYQWVFKNPERIFTAYANTIFVTLAGTAISLWLATMTGYVLARKDFPWRNGFALFFFFTTLFNGGLVPWYILCTRYLGFKNSYLGMIIPMVFSVWNMIIAKNFMRTIPFEIIESAKVDGANDILIYWKLILPLAKPLLATIGLFSALGYWNDWYNCMLFITNENMQNLQYFLQEMLSSIEALKQLVAKGDTGAINNVIIPQAGMKMAMTCVVTGPIIFLYPVIQKYFVKGLTIGAVKG
jgi:putative aldouronate transport system permease protein